LYQEKSGNPALQSVSREESHRAEESAHRAWTEELAGMFAAVAFDM
jgi:hypothetical protein